MAADSERRYADPRSDEYRIFLKQQRRKKRKARAEPEPEPEE